MYGWVPPSENPQYQKKWADFRKIFVAGIESFPITKVKKPYGK